MEGAARYLHSHSNALFHMKGSSSLFLALTFFFILSCSFSTCYSQNQPLIILKGIIINDSTGEAISYATVALSGQGIKTMSNEEGRFIFKFPADDKRDSIYITHVGYKPIAILIKQSDTVISVIKLIAQSQILSEVTIKSINAIDLIKKAISKIPENYPSAPYTLNGFYRMTGKKEKAIVDISEVVFDSYSENYSRKNKQFKVVRARLDKDLTAFGGMEGINMGAKPENMMEDDIVSNVGNSDLLSADGQKEHVFTYKGIVNFEGQDAYVIAFDQKDDIKKSLNKGLIYINTDNLAFLQFTIYKSPKGLKYWDFNFNQRMILKLSDLHIQRLQDSGYITYRKYGDKYYLSHIYGTGKWHIVGGKKHFELNPLRLKYNCLITSIDTAAPQPFNKEEVQHNSRFMENSSPDVNTDITDAYWAGYNLLQSDFNVDSASRIIRANNRTLDYKQSLAIQLRKYEDDKSVRIDSILSFYYQKGQFNGAALVKYQGKVIYEKGFGLADKTRNFANTGQTQFRIGSTSKQFTAMLIMQLVSENKLSLNDSAGAYLPGFYNGKVTIEQLLTHQSGIPDYLGDDRYVAKILTQKYTTDQLIKKFCSDSLEFVPGTQIIYSNSGYVVLAGIIEKVIGEKYSEALEEKILIPLNMTHSYFGKEGHDMAKLAMGYINDEPELVYPVQNVVGAGGITSTAEDLLLWNNALSSNFLLPNEKMKELFKPRVEWDEWGAYYGFGWMIDRFQFDAAKKHIIQYHPGTEVGFYNMLVRQPDKDIFIILLSNKSDFPRFDITDLILNQLN
jgi:CubicO group peptidase (beta-lactamase class C family)